MVTATISELIILETFIYIIAGWIVIAAFQRFTENFFYNGLKFDRELPYHNFIVAIIISAVFLVIIVVFAQVQPDFVAILTGDTPEDTTNSNGDILNSSSNNNNINNNNGFINSVEFDFLQSSTAIPDFQPIDVFPNNIEDELAESFGKSIDSSYPDIFGNIKYSNVAHFDEKTGSGSSHTAQKYGFAQQTSGYRRTKSSRRKRSYGRTNSRNSRRKQRRSQHPDNRLYFTSLAN
jgi:hypothetical protein